jgi:hypothetical protein
MEPNFVKLQGEYCHPVIALVTAGAPTDSIIRAWNYCYPLYNPRFTFGDGGTILHRAAGVGRTKIVRHILRRFPELDIDAQDDNGSTALHYAALTGHKKMIYLLIRNGARRDTKNKYGKTAADCYRENTTWQSLSI